MFHATRILALAVVALGAVGCDGRARLAGLADEAVERAKARNEEIHSLYRAEHAALDGLAQQTGGCPRSTPMPRTYYSMDTAVLNRHADLVRDHRAARRACRTAEGEYLEARDRAREDAAKYHLEAWDPVVEVVRASIAQAERDDLEEILNTAETEEQLWLKLRGLPDTVDRRRAQRMVEQADNAWVAGAGAIGLGLQAFSSAFGDPRQQLSSDVGEAEERIEQRRAVFDTATREVTQLLARLGDLMSQYEVLDASQPAKNSREWRELQRR